VEAAEGLADDAPGEAALEALLVAPAAGLLAAGVVPVLLPQPERDAARTRMASPGPTWCFMMCSFGWILFGWFTPAAARAGSRGADCYDVAG
jgi:hypothetical protein